MTGAAPSDDPKATELATPPVADQELGKELSVPDHLPELVFAFTRAQGTAVTPLRRILADILRGANFYINDVKLNWLLVQQQEAPIDHIPRRKRDQVLMAMGDGFRRDCETAEALGLLGVKYILGMRDMSQREASREHRRGIAWIVRPMVHPDEVRLFRRIYGARFFLISSFESHAERLVALSNLYRDDPLSEYLTVQEAEEAAELTIRMDAGSEPSHQDFLDPKLRKYRVSVASTFPLGDMFVNIVKGSLDGRSHAKLAQLVAQIAGYPFATPDKHEAGMAHAYQARISSASLGRQVGAALVSAGGDLVSVGWNDVPKPGGGLYIQHHSNLSFLRQLGVTESEDDQVSDFRDHSPSVAEDSNLRIRIDILSDLLSRLNDLGFVKLDTIEAYVKERWPISPALGEIVKSADGEVDPLFQEAGAAVSLDQHIRNAEFNAILEYGRSVHAEMHAITTAARNGVDLRGSTLYCTTFPCHECARHIITVGIDQVIYVEPFPKSRVFRLHPDAVVREDGSPDHPDSASSVNHRRIVFAPFIGISPRRHEELFSMVDRKKIDQLDHTGQYPSDARAIWSVADWDVTSGDLRPAFAGPDVDSAIIRRSEEAHVRFIQQILDRFAAERRDSDIDE